MADASSAQIIVSARDGHPAVRDSGPEPKTDDKLYQLAGPT